MPHIDKIILGTVQFGMTYGINNKHGQPGTSEIDSILDFAFQNGLRLLDTAEAYGDAEKLIADYHHRKQKKFGIISKFKGIRKGELRAFVEQKLAAMQLELLDTYMFHSFHEFVEKPWLTDELYSLKQAGLVSKTGVSIYTNDEMKRVVEHKLIDTIQLPFNLLDNGSQRQQLLALAKKQGKDVHVRSVFLQGLFFKQPDELPSKLIPLKQYLLQLRELNRTFGFTMQELALHYALANPLIDKILLGVDSLAHLKENITIINKKALPDLTRLVDAIHVNETELLNPVNW